MASVYRIGVNLAMTSNATGVLAALSRQILGLNQSIGMLQKSLGVIGGALAERIAEHGFEYVRDAIEAATSDGKELLDQQDKLIRAGVTQAQVARLTAAAYQRIARQVPTATGADILKTIGELRTVTGSLDGAVAATPLSLKMQALLENATGTDDEQAGFKLWRSIEMKGLTAGTDAQKKIGQQLMMSYYQDIAGSGGKLDAGDFQTMAARGGAYYMHASPEFLAGPMSVVASDMKGDAAGTVLATFGQFLSGATTLSKQQFAVLDQTLHLIDHSKIQEVDRGGRVNLRPGAIKGSLQYGNDYFSWVQKVLAPALEAANIKPGAEQDSDLAKIGRNRNVTRMLQMFMDPGFVAQIDKDIGIWRQGMMPDKAYGDYINNDPRGVDSALDAQFRSMLQAIGAPMEQAVIPFMREGTGFFTEIGAFAQRHPNIMKDIGIDAAFGPLGQLKTDFDDSLPSITKIGQGISGLFKNVFTPALPDRAAKAMSGYVSSIGTDINKLASGFQKSVSNAFASPFTPAMLTKQREGVKEFADAIAHLARFLYPVATAINSLSNEITNIGANVAGALGGLIHELQGNTWAIPSTGYSKNGIHKQSFTGSSAAAHAVHAALDKRTQLAYDASGVPAGGETKTVVTHVMLGGKEVAKDVTTHKVPTAKWPRLAIAA
jgi:hypothetical protein